MAVEKKEKLVVSIHGKVYDLTDFDHPGGKEIIEVVNGGDASFFYDEAQHSTKAIHMMKQFEVTGAKPFPEVQPKNAQTSNPLDINLKTRKESLINWGISPSLLLNDPRDQVMSDLLLEETFIVLPIVLACCYFNVAWYICLPLFVTNLLCYMHRYILFLHYSSHREVFKSKLVQFWTSNVLCVLYGLAPYTYHLHHVVMHHQENNVMPYDLSSTMPYQRDNVFHFLHYWLRFQLGIWFELPYYAIKKGEYALFAQTFGGAVFYFLSIRFLYPLAPAGVGFFIFGAHLFASFALMLGNFSQHMFVNPKKPLSNFGLTFNAIEDFSNWKGFNDGYHVLHHLHPKLHWSALPQVFHQYQDRLEEKGQVVVKGVEVFLVGVCVLTHQYKFLASKSNRTIEELKELVKPFSFDTVTQTYVHSDKLHAKTK